MAAAHGFEHIPVLAEEAAELLALPADAPARLIDGTVGGGGHSSLLLKRFPRLEILGIDRDEAALEAAAEKCAFAADRIALVRGDFARMRELAADIGWHEADGILLDIGVSSPQLDTPERGFSWRSEGPLDMRMDDRSPLTAGRLLNQAPEEELARIFREYGEIVQARRLARAAVAKRETHPFGTTLDLVRLCDEVLGVARPGRLPHPTLVFQALRIAVNDELGQLAAALKNGCEMLKKGGRIAVISFHSLEDRIVKNFFRDESTGCLCPPGLPVCRCGHAASLRTVTRKPVVPGDAE
ncbi:MAG: 16S rRNA (cytosine(1402)-N(4))-methyltransferase RsmH, partial [Lentisphaeria bacterium]|nr:16S rRNA (cytosine(1402)-N(4))-methyltransferase RsmH [Lentisphaeria bacterium]